MSKENCSSYLDFHVNELKYVTAKQNKEPNRKLTRITVTVNWRANLFLHRQNLRFNWANCRMRNKTNPHPVMDPPASADMDKSEDSLQKFVLFRVHVVSAWRIYATDGWRKEGPVKAQNVVGPESLASPSNFLGSTQIQFFVLRR